MPTTLAVDAGVDISVHILGHTTAVDFGVESAAPLLPLVPFS
jgi:hypothetical protein